MVEIAGNGHIESLGIAALLAALYSFLKGRDRIALSVLGGAVLVKFLPPCFFAVFCALERMAAVQLVCTAHGALRHTPGIFALCLGRRTCICSLGMYAQHWSFNSAAFDVLMLLCGDGQIARGIIALLFLSVVLFLIWRARPPVAQRISDSGGLCSADPYAPSVVCFVVNPISRFFSASTLDRFLTPIGPILSHFDPIPGQRRMGRSRVGSMGRIRWISIGESCVFAFQAHGNLD